MDDEKISSAHGSAGPVTLRKYRPTDFDRLYQIEREAFSKEIAYSHLELQFYLRSAACRSLVAEDDGEIVGFVIAEFEPPEIGHIITIDVAPHRQRQQIGSRLLAEVEEWLWRLGAKAVYLETPVDDTGAKGFYERHGYFAFEQIAGYYNEKTDAVVMMKTSRRRQG
ncbi:MAG TPA: N-acetyltransferase [Blastocatellia bacterium]|nr:N-acetyltransferase [Blastocatellia bacterium]